MTKKEKELLEKFKPGVYKHFKGHLFLALFVAKHSETEEYMVVYVGLYNKKRGQIWARPLEMFVGDKVFEDGRRVKRFKFIRDR